MALALTIQHSAFTIDLWSLAIGSNASVHRPDQVISTHFNFTPQQARERESICHACRGTFSRIKHISASDIERLTLENWLETLTKIKQFRQNRSKNGVDGSSFWHRFNQISLNGSSSDVTNGVERKAWKWLTWLNLNADRIKMADNRSALNFES